MRFNSFLIIALVLLASYAQSQTIPANCRTAFPTTDATRSGCDVCLDTFGRRRTNPPKRVMEENNRILQVKAMDYACEKCSQASCTSCNNVLHTSCTTCADRFFLRAPVARVLQADVKDSVCTACISNCRTCADAASCTDCLDNFGVNTARICAACTVANCDGCGRNNTECQRCKPTFGVSLDKKSCTKCTVAECSDCSNGLATCERCNHTFGVSTDKRTCTKCTMANCQTCDSNAATCTVCSAGFGLSADKRSCVKCTLTNCGVCGADSTICESCTLGFGKIGRAHV